jgi:hypothetical protein
LPYNSKQETGWVKWLLVGLVAYGILAWFLPERRYYD